MATTPLIQHDALDCVFAYRAGHAISVARFLHDVEHLARLLPDKKYILNLCTDRYHFTVSFAAALLRKQTSLLPPNYTPSFVDQLGHLYPDLYCVDDGEITSLVVDVMHYPQLPPPDNVMRSIPAIPSAQAAALVFTSGSTGQPVAHPKSWGSLCLGAKAEAVSLNIKTNSGLAMLSTVPAQHMYGLESCMLLAMQTGCALVAERPFFPADISAQLLALPLPRCLVTTPVHLRTLLSASAVLPSVEFVLCATAHLPLQLAIEAETRFDAPLREIYGCTEAGMVAARRTTQGTTWHPLPGVTLRQDEQGTRAYGGHIEIEALLSDVIELNQDGSFFLHGRTADLVNIAGKRTSLSSLNHFLNEIPGVQDGVFFMPEDHDGVLQRPMAFVVAPGLKSENILSALRNSIDSVFLPRPLYFVSSLNRNSTGKVTREALSKLMEQCARK